jgi:hypothetical protein
MDEDYDDDFEGGPANNNDDDGGGGGGGGGGVVNVGPEVDSPTVPQRPSGAKPTRFVATPHTPHRVIGSSKAAGDLSVEARDAGDADQTNSSPPINTAADERAAEQTPVDDDAQDIRCRACNEAFEAPPSELKSPHLLRCLHTICTECCAAAATERTAAAASEVTCPVCKDLTEVPQEGVGALPLNFAAIKLVKQRILLGQEVPRCGLCGDAGVQSFCVDCQELICSSCVAMHDKVKTFQGHARTALSGAKNTQYIAAPPPTCPHHEGCELDLWCETCQMPICRDCIVKMHKDHNYTFVAEAAPAHRNDIRTAEKDAEARKKDAQSAIDEVDSTVRTLERRGRDLTAQVAGRFDELLAAVEQRKDAVLKSIGHAVGSKTERLLGQRAALEAVRERFDVARHTARQTVAHGTDAELIVWTGHIVDRTHEIASETYQREPVETGRLECLDNAPDLLASMEKWMALRGGGTAAFRSVARGAGLAEARCFMPTEFTIVAMNTDGNPRNEGGDAVTVDIRVRTEGLQAWHDDAPLPCASVTVTDMGDGTYAATYEPHLESLAWLHIHMNGHPISSSPYPLAVVSAFSLPPFYRTSRGTVQVEEDGRAVRVTGGTGFHVATVAAPLPARGVSFWKMVVRQLKDNNWCLLGIIGDRNPTESSYMHPTVNGWACGADVFVGGKNHSGDGGWSGFEQGDEIVFKYDPREQTLAMTVPRLFDRRFVINVGPAPSDGFFLHVNLSATGDRVELVAVDSLAVAKAGYNNNNADEHPPTAATNHDDGRILPSSLV